MDERKSHASACARVVGPLIEWLKQVCDVFWLDADAIIGDAY